MDRRIKGPRREIESEIGRTVEERRLEDIDRLAVLRVNELLRFLDRHQLRCIRLRLELTGNINGVQHGAVVRTDEAQLEYIVAHVSANVTVLVILNPANPRRRHLVDGAEAGPRGASDDVDRTLTRSDALLGMNCASTLRGVMMANSWSREGNRTT